jgi:hypothetical protein
VEGANQSSQFLHCGGGTCLDLIIFFKKVILTVQENSKKKELLNKITVIC